MTLGELQTAARIDFGVQLINAPPPQRPCGIWMIENRSNRAARPAAIAGLCASALAVLVPLVFGALSPSYSHVHNYISELGETGSPYAVWVNGAGFLPIGLAVFLFLFLAQLPVARRSILLFSSVGWAYVLAAFFPCDPGCPEQGSLSQLVHNASAIVCYPATIAGLILMASSLRKDPQWKKLAGFAMVCSLLVAAGFGLMLVPEFELWRGLSQRVAEIATFGWIAVLSLAMLKAS